MISHLAALLLALSICLLPVSARRVTDHRVVQLVRSTAHDSVFTSPGDVSAPLSTGTAISAGYKHTCAVTERGGVKCWGANGSGQLGDGTTVERRLPVEVVGLGPGSAVVTVAAGGAHTCALTAGGGVKCWGSNHRGQLGDGGWAWQPTPVDVIGFGAGHKAVAIAAGWAHTCALTETGSVMCWGNNQDGQLGNGTTQSRAEPVNVVGLVGGVTDLSVGWAHSCVVTASGGALCWGRNTVGQLGDGTQETRRLPVDVVGLGAGSGVTRIAAGEDHTCAAVAGGAMCWGYNDYGQLGIGVRDWTFHTATSVIGLGPGSGVSSVAAGGDHTCALAAEAATQCWGGNLYGQMGDGTRTERFSPANVVGLDSGGSVTAVVAGADHTCALMGGGIACWGSNESGQSGNGVPFPNLTPTETIGLPAGSDILAVAAGSAHTCALLHGGVSCWGVNSDGELGDGTQTERFRRADVSGLEPGGEAMAVGAGGWHACTLVAGGVKCWGDNQYGQLGDGTAEDRWTPVDVAGLGPGSGVTSVSVGQDHTCVVQANGEVLCWGRNQAGQLGDGTKIDHWQPAHVTGLGSGTFAVSAGERHTCAVTTAGAWCWGANYAGQLGDGSETDRLTPVAVIGLDANSGVTAISAGANHTCAMVAGGVKCWGRNEDGEVGDGSGEDRKTPVAVLGLGPGSGVTEVEAMYYRSCALRAGGLQCWGNNYSGGLGDGTETDRLSPVNVVGLGAGSGVTDVVGGSFHTCAVVMGGLQCWGSNYFGQLGVNPGWEPTVVAGFQQGVPRMLYLPQIFR